MKPEKMKKIKAKQIFKKIRDSSEFRFFLAIL